MSTKEDIKKELELLKKEGSAPEWLTWMSYAMLKESYLLDKTPRERYRVMAKAAASYMPRHLHPEKWEEKFFQLFWKGYLAASTPVMGNLGTERGLAVSCLTGDTWLHTECGAKRIKNIKIGDRVLTHKGRFKTVTHTQNRQSNGDLYELRVKNRPTKIEITGNHPVLTNLGWVRVDELNPHLHLIATNNVIDWTANNTCIDLSGYLQEGFIVENNIILKPLCDKNQKKYKRKFSKNYTPLKCKVDIDEDLAWVLGLWFAEGSVSNRSVRFTMSVSETNILERALEILNQKFGVNGTVSITERKMKNGKIRKWSNLDVNSFFLADYFKNEFGASCLTKKIPISIKNMEMENLESFFDGFYCGDGQKSKEHVPKITIHNPYLMMGLYEIGLKIKLDVRPSFQTKDNSSGTKTHVYSCYVHNYGHHHRDSRKSKRFADGGIEFNDGLKYSPFSLKKLDKNETVYDITVEDDQSFSICGVIVHNCSASYVADTMWDISYTGHELEMLSKYGFGTSAFLDVRGGYEPIVTGGHTNPTADWVEKYWVSQNKVSQGGLRRGSTAIYLDFWHKDLMDILPMMEKLEKLHLGVICDDSVKAALERGDEDAMRRYLTILQWRARKGKPYIIFIDNARRQDPPFYKKLGLSTKQSNLCTEIFQHTSSEHTLSCVLSSMVGNKFDEWKDTDAVFDATVFLDCVCEDLIQRGSKIKGLERVVASAKASRALGLGLLGFHTYLQEKMFPIDGFDARLVNAQMFKHLHDESLRASKWMAKNLGEPEWLKGTGMRNSHRTAIAPNTSSAFIAGAKSQGIEPNMANIFNQKLAKVGSIERINPTLLRILKERGQFNDEIVESISYAKGSVQHIDSSILSDHEKEVFKTAYEINQKVLIDLAEQRQKFICQGQSLNLFFDANEDENWIHEVHKHAFNCTNLKSLYYVRTQPGITADKDDTCKACEG